MGQKFPFDTFIKTSSNKENTVPSKKNISLKELKLHDKSSTKNIITEIQTLNTTSTGFSSIELEITTNELHKRLKQSVSPEKYNAFFKGSLIVTDISMDYVHFQVTTELIKTMIESQFSDSIKMALAEILGKSYHFSITIKLEAKKESSSINELSDRELYNAPKSPSEAKFTLNLQQTKEDIHSKIESQYIDHMNDTNNVLIDGNKSFDNFITGPSNNLACASATAIAKHPGKMGKYPSLYIYSDSGLGKTHLLHAVANSIRKSFPEYSICLITAREFMKEMINAIRQKKRQDFQKKYSEKFDVLMIDDIHELAHKEGTQEEFFHIFNSLHTKGKQLIFTSDKAPDKIDGIEQRIRTRLQSCLVVDIQKPDLETRIALLKRKSFELDIFLQDDIVNLIAVSIKNSIRELEGAIVRLKAYEELMQVEIDRETAKDVLDLSSAEQNKSISLDDIAKCTATYYKVYLADLKSKVRQKSIVNARFVAMYLSRKVINATQVEIGHYYGGRDHSSVVHAEKEITKRLAIDATLSKDVTQIESSL